MSDITCIFCVNPKFEREDEIYKHFDDYFDYVTLNSLFTLFWDNCVINYAEKTEYAELFEKVTSSWDEEPSKQVEQGLKGISYHELHKFMEAIRYMDEHKEEILNLADNCEVKGNRFEKEYESSAIKMAAMHYLVEHNFFKDFLMYFEKLQEGDVLVVSIGG